jgi:hypothetical protein
VRVGSRLGLASWVACAAPHDSPVGAGAQGRWASAEDVGSHHVTYTPSRESDTHWGSSSFVRGAPVKKSD